MTAGGINKALWLNERSDGYDQVMVSTSPNEGLNPSSFPV